MREMEFLSFPFFAWRVPIPLLLLLSLSLPLSPLEIFIWMKRAGKGGRDTRKGSRGGFVGRPPLRLEGEGFDEAIFFTKVYLSSKVLLPFSNIVLKINIVSKRCKCRRKRQQQTTMNGTRGRRQGGGGGTALKNSVYVFICVRARGSGEHVEKGWKALLLLNKNVRIRPKHLPYLI